MNIIKYYCTAERCIWRVWTSNNTGYCSKIKCPYGNMRAKKNTENKTIKISNITKSALSLREAMEKVGRNTKEEAKAFNEIQMKVEKKVGENRNAKQKKAKS